MRLTLPRLYAILDVDVIAAHRLQPLDVLDHWLEVGIRLVQLRAKSMTMGPMVALGDAAVERTRAAGASLFINDRPDVARLTHALGVHLGQADLTAADARRLLTPAQAIGLSTHSIEQASRAIADGADYVAIGPVHATPTKANPDPVVGLEGVRRAAAAARAAGVPLVAIGGITLSSAPGVLAAGADSVAVISDLFVDGWQERARAYVRALD